MDEHRAKRTRTAARYPVGVPVHPFASRARRLGAIGLLLLLVLGVTLVRAQSQPVMKPPELRVSYELSLPLDSMPVPAGSTVTLLLGIDAVGNVTEVQVDESLRPDVDAAAEELARALRFAPATRDGVAMASTVRLRLAVPGTFNRFNTEPPSATTAPTLQLQAETRSNESTEEEAPLGEYSARATVQRPDPGAATQVTLQREELTTVPGTFGEPLRVVSTLPGVTRTPFGLGYFLVRGASFENTGFLVDGFPVPILYHLGAGPAVLSSRLVQSLDFYPGGYPVSYGRFLGGVIGLRTGPPPSESFRGELEVDLFRASALAVVPFQEGRGTVTAAYRRSYFDLILPLVTDGFDLFYQDWQVRLDYRVHENLDASLFWFGSEDSLEVSTSRGAGVTDATANTSLNYRFDRLIGSLTWRIGPATRLKWASTIGIDRTRVGRVAPGDSSQSTRLDGTTLGQRLELSLRHNDTWSTSYGVDTLALLYEVETPLPVPEGIGRINPPINSFTTQNTTSLALTPMTLTAAPYAEAVLRTGKLEATAGLRVDVMNYARVLVAVVDPRTVARFKLSDAVTLKAATGLFAQPALPFQIDTTLGNPEMRPQRSWQSSAGVELALPWTLEVQSQLFYSQMSRLGRTTPQIVEDRDGQPRRQVFVDDGQGRAYGLELLVRRKLERGLYGWLSYTLSWSERYLEGGETLPFFFDQRHVLNLALSYAWQKWRFGTRLQLASGRPTRPVNGGAYDADENEYEPIRGGFSARLPAFHQVDVRVDRDFEWSRYVRGSVYLDVLNVLNTQNTEGYLYQYDLQKRARLPSLPILPTLGFRLEVM